MSGFDKNDIVELADLPTEFTNFIKMCNGVDFDFTNCTVGTDEHRVKINDDDEIEERFVDISVNENTVEKGKSMNYTYSAGFTLSEFGYRMFNTYKGIVDEGKEKYIEKFLHALPEIKSIQTKEYEAVLAKYIAERNVSCSESTIVDAFTIVATEQFDSVVQRYDGLNKKVEDFTSRKKSAYDASLHTRDMDAILSENVLKGGIYSISGRALLFEAEINETGMIDVLKTNSFESITDLVWDADEEEFVPIDYKKCSVASLRERGIVPFKSESIDFNSLLSEHDIDDCRQSPIGVIYQLKDMLLAKGFTLEGTNGKVS